MENGGFARFESMVTNSLILHFTLSILHFAVAATIAAATAVAAAKTRSASAASRMYGAAAAATLSTGTRSGIWEASSSIPRSVPSAGCRDEDKPRPDVRHPLHESSISKFHPSLYAYEACGVMYAAASAEVDYS